MNDYNKKRYEDEKKEEALGKKEAEMKSKVEEVKVEDKGKA